MSTVKRQPTQSSIPTNRGCGLQPRNSPESLQTMHCPNECSKCKARRPPTVKETLCPHCLSVEAKRIARQRALPKRQLEDVQETDAEEREAEDWPRLEDVDQDTVTDTDGDLTQDLSQGTAEADDEGSDTSETVTETADTTTTRTTAKTRTESDDETTADELTDETEDISEDVTEGKGDGGKKGSKNEHETRSDSTCTSEERVSPISAYSFDTKHEDLVKVVNLAGEPSRKHKEAVKKTRGRESRSPTRRGAKVPSNTDESVVKLYKHDDRNGPKEPQEIATKKYTEPVKEKRMPIEFKVYPVLKVTRQPPPTKGKQVGAEEDIETKLARLIKMRQKDKERELQEQQKRHTEDKMLQHGNSDAVKLKKNVMKIREKHIKCQCS